MSLRKDRQTRLERERTLNKTGIECEDCRHYAPGNGGCLMVKIKASAARAPHSLCGLGAILFSAKVDHGANLLGVAPAGMRAILQTEADRPMRGGDKELGHESLFGDSHLQRSLF